VGEEIGEETNYEHWQGYVQFYNQKSAKQVKNLLTNETHIEKAKGTTKRNIEYCSKQHKVRYQKNVDSWKPIQDERQKQERRDARTREIIKDAETLEPEAFKDKWPTEWYLRRSNVEKIMIESMGKRATIWCGKLQEKNIWLWGPPGVGKSRWAMKQQPMTNILKKNTNKWWCGYSIANTKLVILEDYPAMPLGDLLQHHVKIWGDRHPFLGEIKNGGTLVEPGRWGMVITSNYPIEKCFSHKEDVEAIQRRFHEIYMTQHNAVLIEAIGIDFQRIEQNRQTKEQEEKHVPTEEELENVRKHVQETVEMMDEARERGEQGLDDVEW
jgi:hypothetical protein